MRVETTFHLVATGREADVSAWTQKLGIAPSGCARRGERAGTAPSPDSWWALVLAERQVSGVEEPLLEILDKLLPLKGEIAALAAAEDLEMTATSYVWQDGQGPVADLSPSAIQGLCQLGCSYSVVAYE